MSHEWRRPQRCECSKIPYRSEGDALAAATSRSEDAGVPLHVYKCPGSSSWHLAARGFRPEALRSRARILAWHVSRLREVSREDLLDIFGYAPYSRQSKKLYEVLGAFRRLGLVEWDSPQAGWVRAADQDGLLRVMMVGLEEYASAREPAA